MTSMRPELSLGESLDYGSLSLHKKQVHTLFTYVADYTLYKSFLEDIGHSLNLTYTTTAAYTTNM